MTVRYTLYWEANSGLPRSGEVVFSSCGNVQDIVYINQDGPGIPKSTDYLSDTGNAVIDLEEAGTLQLKVYPNPFSETLTIEFELSQNEEVEIAVFDISGRLIRKFDQMGIRGVNHTTWNGTDQYGNKVITGLYFVHFTNGEGVKVEKVSFIGNKQNNNQ